MVSSDSDLYQGDGYAPNTISLTSISCNFPKKLKFDPSGNGYCRLDEIAAITPLLELARREYPAIYRDWKVLTYSNPMETGPVHSLRFSRVR